MENHYYRCNNGLFVVILMYYHICNNRHNIGYDRVCRVGTKLALIKVRGKSCKLSWFCSFSLVQFGFVQFGLV